MSTIFKARWLLAIDKPPVHDAWVELEGGRVRRVGAGRPPAAAEDLGDVAILPGLVNAHTHLELSWMGGRIPPAESMVQWIRALLALRSTTRVAGEFMRLQAIRAAVGTMRDTGTVLVGDVSNSLAAVGPLCDAGLGGVIFHELLGFSVVDPDAIVRDAWERVDRTLTETGAVLAQPPIRGSVVAHAPYSVSPDLFAAIGQAHRHPPLTVHVGESAEEVEFLRTGGGAFRALLEDLGTWDHGWEPPQLDPVAYLDALGYLQPGMLAVHAVHLDDRALEHLRTAGAVVVTCPRSNVRVGGGIPRVGHFYAAGVPVAIGTDSLASTSTLNLFDELAELRRIAPGVTAASLLESATRIGAEALGFGVSHGTIGPGKSASLIQVRVPASVTDVEEYLVSGVEASAIGRIT